MKHAYSFYCHALSAGSHAPCCIALLVALLLHTFSAFAQEPSQRLLVTLDDLPFGYTGGLSEREKTEAFSSIMQALHRYRVPALGFITTANITDSTRSLLHAFREKGFLLGNHTHTHPDLHQLTAAAYIRDIQLCDSLAAPWIGKQKYFRYTMLRQGNTAAKRDSVARYLQQQGYQVVPVSIDNDEWLYNKQFTDAYTAGDTVLMKDIGTKYQEHIRQQTLHFQQLARQLLGRPVVHILLLHANFINGYYLDDILRSYLRQGWKFVDVETALSDPLYHMQDHYLGEKGPSQLERIQYKKP